MTIFLLLLLLVALVSALWVSWIEPRQVKWRYHDVHLENLKAPLTVAVIGDIQPNSYHWPTERLHTLFSSIQTTCEPDLVLWLGDYFNAPTDLSKEFLQDHPQIDKWISDHLPSMGQIAGAMTQLKGRLGTYAILGNHDWAWSGTETAMQLTEAGIHVLMDDVVMVRDPDSGAALQIVGYEDISSGRVPNYAVVHQHLDPKVANLALSHSPDAFPEAHGGPSLMLSGHTHGGQIRIPFIGALVLPVKHTQYDMGWFHEAGRSLFVTAGLGTSLPPVRLLCPPEIVVMTLRPKDAQPDGSDDD